MCQKCKKNSCSGGCSESSMADMQSQIDSLTGFIDTLTALTKFLNGHPILALNDPDDVVQFDLTTGKGEGDWIGWGICDGTNYPGTDGNIATPDLRDKFLVGSQGAYAIDATGGLDSVVLDLTMIPAHSHAVTDPGHTHIVVDPGHDHNVTDPGHVHAATAANHFHLFTTDLAGDHAHSYDRIDVSGTDYSIPPSIPPDQLDFSFDTQDTTTNGEHSHTGITDPAVVAVTIVQAFTGIDMDQAFTGISNDDAVTGITIANAGGGLGHENRPPFHALLFVKKIF